MTHAASPAMQPLDLGRVIRTVVRRLPRIVAGAVIIGAVTAAVLSTMAPRYLSQVQLEVRGSAMLEAGAPPDKEAVGTHVRAMMSTELALKMAQALGLSQRPDFNSALEPPDFFGQTLRKIGLGQPKPGETDEDRLLQAYYKQVRAYQVRETRSVIIDCTTTDAKFSAECANKLADLYRESLRGRAVGENDDFRIKLGPQVERLTQEVALAEAQVTEFRGQANLFQGGGQQGAQLKDQQLGEMTAELTRASTARAEAEARASSAREMLARGTAGANPDVQKSTLVPRLEESRVRLERQISELSATLLPAHPRMRQLSSELASLQRQIRDEVQKVVESLANDARIAAEREAGVRRRIDDVKRTVVSSATDGARLAQLEAVVRAKRAELERVQKQFEAAQSTAKSGVVQPAVEIVSRAYASNEKVFPKTSMMSALAAVAAFIFGLAWAFLRQIAMGGQSSTEAPRARAKSPELTRAPTITEAPMAAHPVAAPPSKALAQKVEPAVSAPPQVPAAAPPASSEVATPVIEAAATLIAHARTGAPFRSMITGFDAATDARGEALDLVRALAATGRQSVLVNWAGGDRIEAGTGHAPGIAELLVGDAALADAIVEIPGSSAKFIGPGSGAIPQPVDGDAACVVLDALDEVFDHVVVYATYQRAQDLFAAIEGRCDAGIMVLASARQGVVKPNQFLGYEVPNFPVVPVVRGQRLSQRVGAVSERGLTGLYKPFSNRT